MYFSVIILLLALLGSFDLLSAQYRTEDIYVPYECDQVVGPGDHVLLEYRAYFANGTLATMHTKPSILVHAQVTTQVS